MFREAVRAVIDTCDGLNVVAEAADGLEALQKALELRPEVVLSEIALPRLSGLELARRLATSGSRSRVLILSGSEGRSQVHEAMRAGAAGYLTKSGSASDLIEAIEAVRAGRGYLSSSVARHVVDVIARQERGACSSASELTGREREVLQLVAEGLSSKEIACALSISTRTVESHRAKLMEKLGIHRVSGLVRLAIREGLIEP